MKTSVLIALLVGLSGCSWVKVTPEGERVRLMQATDDMASCKRLGQATAKVVSKVVFNRNAQKVATELAGLAKNQAAQMGGDTIIPTSEVVDGQRTFAIYQCVQP